MFQAGLVVLGTLACSGCFLSGFFAFLVLWAFLVVLLAAVFVLPAAFISARFLALKSRTILDT